MPDWRECWACKKVLRDAAWRFFVYGLTFHIVDLRISIDEVWDRHQRLLNEPNLLGKWGY
jgi:hypothetical protein